MLELDLNGQSATVGLLAVDKAFYGLKADNKLTAKQVSCLNILQVFSHFKITYILESLSFCTYFLGIFYHEVT